MADYVDAAVPARHFSTITTIHRSNKMAAVLSVAFERWSAVNGPVSENLTSVIALPNPGNKAFYAIQLQRNGDIATVRGTAAFFEGALCTCTRSEKSAAITLPNALAAHRVPVFCCRAAVADLLARPHELALVHWLAPDELRAHFADVRYSDDAIVDLPASEPMAPSEPIAPSDPMALNAQTLDICISGGLRTVVTALCLLKRCVLDHVARVRVFALTWRDVHQGYSAGAVRFLHDFFGPALCQYAEFDDLGADVHAAERERVRVAAATRAVTPDALRPPFVPELWFRRKVCNDMRRHASVTPPPLVLRTRFDTFMGVVPDFRAVAPGAVLASVDLLLLAAPADADVEAELGAVFPAHHAQVAAAWPPGEAAMWEFGSEAHVVVRMREARIAVTENPRLGRFGRTAFEGVPDAKSARFRYPRCPVLHTAAIH